MMDAQQHQSPKQQLVQGLRNLFPNHTSAWIAQAALAVGQLQEDVAAGLVSLNADDRRATIEAAVAAAAAAAPPAAAVAATTSAGHNSPRRQFQDWAKQNPLQSTPCDPQAMMQLITSMQLPGDIGSLLAKYMYQVPPTGFFTTAPTVGQSISAAFTRRDQVDLFKSHIMAQQATPVRAVVTHGRRRTGKSFGTPHSLVTAYAECEAAGVAVLVPPAPSSSSTMLTPRSGSSSSTMPAPRSSSSSSTMPARVPWIVHMPCDAVSPGPSQPQLELLFDVMVYLRVPMVLDEWTLWQHVGPALQYVLGRQTGTSAASNPVLRAQFVLIDSDHARVSAAVHPSLLGREPIGIVSARMPNPNIQLVASLFYHLRPAQYNTGLLRTIATCGHRLDRLFLDPILITSLSIASLADHTVLRGSPLQALVQVVQQGYATVQDPYVLELSAAGYLRYDSFNKQKLLLADPLLVTIGTLGLVGAEGDLNNMELARDMANAEGKVLELVARQLVPEMLEVLGMAGDFTCFFGSIGQAELDLLVQPNTGPMVLVSCKRSQAAQEKSCFEKHLQLLKGVEGRQWQGKHDKLHDYRLNNAVRIIQNMVDRQRLVLVGLSAVPANPPPCIPTFEFVVNLEGQQHTLQCEYHNMLLHEVLKPANPEMLIEAQALDSLE